MADSHRLFNTPKHHCLYTGASQFSDFQEIQLLRNFSQKLKSLPQKNSVPNISRRENLLTVQARLITKKISKKVPHGSNARRRLGTLVARSPLRVRNFIYTVLSSEVSGNQQAIGFAYSADLGFGLNTSRNPRVSIVIPVHNAWFTTLKCLRALQINADTTPYEVILVDDASSDHTEEFAKAIRGINLIRLNDNIGYLRATNLGASYAKAEYLVLLNNDTEPVSGWLDALVSEMDSDPQVAICGSTLIYPNGSLQEAGGQIFKEGNAWNLGRGKNPLNPMFRFKREIDYASAASIIVRQTFWRNVGGFDEQFTPAYCEDSDLCLQAWQRGFKVIYSPDSWVIHHEGISHGTSVSSGLKSYQVTNQEKLKSKWEETLVEHWSDCGEPRIERNRDSKGIIFVADHQLPAMARDAGSIRTVQIIKHLISLNYHVVLSALDPSTTETDVAFLRNIGVEVHPDWKVALEALSWRKSRLTFNWLVRAEVYDFFVDRLIDINPKARQIADLMDLNYEDNQNKIEIDSRQLRIAQKSDNTVLVSDIEAALLTNALKNRSVEVVWAEYEPRDIGVSFENSNGLLFVGGFRHTPNVEGILWFTSQVLPHLRMSGFMDPIRVVGSGLSKEDRIKLGNSGVELLGRIDDLDDIYRKSRIAIAPLRTGRGRKGKIGEALSLGIPVVTTTVGAEGFSFTSTMGIGVADEPKEFASLIMRIYSSPENWATMSEFGREYSAKYLSSGAMLRAIKSVLGEK